MDEVALRQLADSMGMKKSASASAAELTEYILDNQAIDLAKEEVSKQPAKKAAKEKKPRAKKAAKKAADTAAESVAEQPKTELTVVPEAAPESAEAQPKKRTRKTKAKRTETQEPTAENPAVTDTPHTQNDDKVTETPQPEQPAPAFIETEAKAEGLADDVIIGPSEVDVPLPPFLPITIADDKRLEKEEIEPAQTVQPLEEPQAETTPKPEIPQRPVQKAPVKSSKPSLDSFFSKAKGKTFTPRSQREIEEAAIAAAQAPIELHEPVAETMAPAIPTAPQRPQLQPQMPPQQRVLSKKQLRAQQRLE
ncbi:MAG: hypothetical protein K2K26_11320, partial [Muribaculaceae bacterium]|nr:hypothetical protein [Muribaculaceae bacterium]